MKAAIRVLAVALYAVILGIDPANAASNSFVAANDVTWTALGKDENDSMPIGNGDLAANVWTERNGDLVILVANSDAWTEMGKLVRLGRVRLHLTPNPFVNAPDFTQTLRIEDGSIQIKDGENIVLVWADANQPVIHVEGNLSQPSILRANLEVWRTQTHPYDGHSSDKGGLFEFGSYSVPLNFEADTVLATTGNRLSWYHFNRASIYPLVLEQEHLKQAADMFPDPLLHRCFGASMLGPGLVSRDDRTLASQEPSRKLRLYLVALTTPFAASPQAWKSSLDRLTGKVNAVPINTARIASAHWWQQFWDRSWIHVMGTADAEKVSQGYIMQRYMMAASSRGAFPTKFNGGLFTVGHDIAANIDSTNGEHDPEHRAWGNSYWNQNNRLLYWPLVATGDLDLLQPRFDMYIHALPLAEERTHQYFHHGGAAFIETMYFWGLPNLHDFGWNNPTDELQSTWMRYHIQGALEVTAEMLDEYDVTRDAAFAQKEILPFATAVLAYYDQHWQHGENGKILISPAQSLETYQLDAVNPTPDNAGMKDVLPKLLSLPATVTTAQQRQTWTRLLANLPQIATGRTHNGKLPRVLQSQDPDGTTVILPAEEYGPTRNGENPQLYVTFPYRLYGVGKPDLKLARDSFASRLFPQDTCWGQDGPQAAALGLTTIAQKAVIDEFGNYGNQRFRWFWKAGHDWIPDLDNGGTGMIALQADAHAD